MQYELIDRVPIHRSGDRTVGIPMYFREWVFSHVFEA